GFTRIVAGGCDVDSPSRAILGITPRGRVFAYYDTDRFDDRGDDIGPAGQVGRGFAGLVFE
ncbi:MAG: hypothetical protein ACRCZD_19575, partial [Phycicoccus sp.]